MARRPPLLLGSVTDRDPAAIGAAAGAAIAAGADVAEIRADLAADPAPEALHAALPPLTPACYTLRSAVQGGGFTGTAEAAVALRARAAAAGFDWVDVEAPAGGPVPPLPAATRTIVSHHDLQGVPADPAGLAHRLGATGADVVKIVGTAHEPADAAPLLDLLPGDGRLAAWCQGEAGIPSRILALRRGSALMFGAVDGAAPAAPGQLTLGELIHRYRVATLTEATAVYGVAGDPVAHSRGPALHNAVFADAGIDAVYLPVRTGDLPATVRFLAPHGLQGLSVTIPHKAAAAALGDPTAPVAAQAGSANTLTRAGDGWEAVSTDGSGLLSALVEALGGTAGAPPVLLLGGGGTARIALAALRAAGLPVTVAARTRAPIADLAGDLGAALVDWDARHEVPARVVINATPLGMNPDDPLPADPARIDGLELCLDCVYTPPDTAFLAAAADAGCATVSGVRMFLHQAFGQLQAWGLPVTFDGVERAWEALA